MVDQTTDETVKLFLRAAKIDGDDKLFSIGPFGSRVSFASQQRRALNTVWALEQQGKIGPGKKVAVIGGGLAGVMAAVALAARKCVVHLYERESAVLNLQQLTTHRHVHPSVNFWPEQPLNPTTTFPFLDWHADKCSQVIDTLRQEWTQYFAGWINKIFLGTTVDKLEPADDGIEVVASGKSAPAAPVSYSVVILAVGFGGEKVVAGIDSKSYWDLDDLAHSEGSGDHEMVSGVGDGGLIDVLRIVHRNFNKGLLGLKLIEILDESGIGPLVLDLEARILDKYMREEDAEAAAAEYAAGYASLVEDAPPNATALLDESIRQDLQKPVSLIGRTAYPYVLTSAPVHKFMLAHALNRGAIEYAKGDLSDGPNLAPGPLRVPCVVRHGPNNDLSGLVEAGKIKSLRQRQLVISDILANVPYDGSYWWNWKDYPEQDFESPAFVQFRLKNARQYVLNEYNEMLFREDRLYYVLQQPSRPEFSRFPSKLFGIRTEVRPQKVFAAP